MASALLTMQTSTIGLVQSMKDEKEAEFLELRYPQEKVQSLREMNGPDTEAIEPQATQTSDTAHTAEPAEPVIDPLDIAKLSVDLVKVNMSASSAPHHRRSTSFPLN
jgi:hypothetical protein